MMTTTSEPTDDTPRRIDGGCMVTPFDIQAILAACPALYAEWRKAPFILAYGYDGRVEVRYWSPDMDEDQTGIPSR